MDLEGVAQRGQTSISEVFRTSRWVWSCPEKNQLLVSSSSGSRIRRTRLLSGIAWVLRYGFGVDTQTVAGTDPGYAFFASNSPTIERQEPLLASWWVEPFSFKHRR